MKAFLLLFVAHQGLANYGFHYATAPLNSHKQKERIDEERELDQIGTLPPLIEMPHLGGGSQPINRNEPCPPCPAPAPPIANCPEVKCPELICDVVKADAEENDNFIDHSSLLQEEERLRARFSRRNKRQITVSSIVQLSNKCNDKYLRNIMFDSISSNIVVAKVTIAERASHEIGGHFDVICTTGVFSYYVAARLFCEVTREGTTCFAFRHDDLGSEIGGGFVAGMGRPLQQGEADSSERIEEIRMERRQPSAAILDAEDEADFSIANQWLRTTTTHPDERTEEEEVDPHTQNIREETFNELIAELERRQQHS